MPLATHLWMASSHRDCSGPSGLAMGPPAKPTTIPVASAMRLMSEASRGISEATDAVNNPIGAPMRVTATRTRWARATNVGSRAKHAAVVVNAASHAAADRTCEAGAIRKSDAGTPTMSATQANVSAAESRSAAPRSSRRTRRRCQVATIVTTRRTQLPRRSQFRPRRAARKAPPAKNTCEWERPPRKLRRVLTAPAANRRSERCAPGEQTAERRDASDGNQRRSRGHRRCDGGDRFERSGSVGSHRRVRRAAHLRKRPRVLRFGSPGSPNPRRAREARCEPRRPRAGEAERAEPETPSPGPRGSQRRDEHIAHAEQRQEQRSGSPGHRGDSIACQGAASFLNRCSGPGGV